MAERESLNLEQAADKLSSLFKQQQGEEDAQPETTPESQDLADEETSEETAIEAVSEESGEQPELEDEQSSQARDEGAETGAEAIELGADQFAELLGIGDDRLSVNDEGKVSFRAEVGSEAVDVSLDQLINAYQGDANLTNRSKELAEKAKAQEDALSQLSEQSNQLLQLQEALKQGLKEQFLAPFQVDESLKNEDREEYIIRKGDFAEREKQFNTLMNETNNTLQEQQGKINEQVNQQIATYLQTQQQLLGEKLPNFSEQNQKDLVSYLKNEGFTDTEIGGEMKDGRVVSLGISDARVLAMMFKAMQFDKGAENVKKKLDKPLPRVLKPGTKPSKQTVRTEKTKKLRQNLKKSGSMQDAAALFKTMREG